MNTPSSPLSQKSFGHPKGLFYLFFAELWERFSFYGMKALLILYMTKQLMFSDTMSIGIFAAYMSLVYVTPTFGGILADKVLGFRKAIFLGGVLMAIGHFLLTIEQPIFFYLSLAFIIVGNGFFKPNISTFVGALYQDDEVKKDAGFTIFYMGINIGGAVAPLLCAWLAEVYGWHYGFMAAGLGMLLGLFIFHRGIQTNVFGEKGLVPNVVEFSIKKYGITKGNWVALLAVVLVPVFALFVRFYQYEHYLVWITSFVIIAALVKICLGLSKPARNKVMAAAYFTVLMTIFWAIFEQAGSSLTLFADRNVTLVGLNAAQTNSINSGYIILLAIPFSMFWTYLSKKKSNPNSAVKSGFGLLLLGLAFIVFSLSARSAIDAMTPMWYLFVGYFILTVGELCISPIGLSKMTELSPLKYVSFIMGVFFTSSFYGHFFAGKIAALTAVSEGAQSPFSQGFFGQLVSFITSLDFQSSVTLGESHEQLFSYVSVYAVFGLLSVMLGVLALVVSPLIKRLMGDVK
ncbi:MAG: peptide MFS transporter [Flavobacteriales bacterium]